MFKVISYEQGIKGLTTTFETIEEAAGYIANLHNLLKGAGQVQGRDYDLELVEA